jgi:uncharacterized protein (TIGR02118 family)
MIKLVYVIRKRHDVSEKDFREYWLKTHGPLVRGFAKGMRAKKYVQSHTVFEDVGKQIRGTRKMLETYDGITEVWWDSLEDFNSGGDSEERQKAARALLEDEARFIDFERSSIFLTEEQEIFDYSR